MSGCSPKDETLEEIERLIDRKRASQLLLPELNSSFAALSLPRFTADAGKLQALEQKNEFLAVDLAAKGARAALLETELVALRASVEEREAALQEQLATLKAEGQAMRGQLSAALGRLADVQERLEGARSAAASAETAAADRLAAQRESLEKKLNRARAKAAEERGAAAGLQKVGAGLAQKLRRAETELAEARAFFHQQAGLVAQLEPPVRLRRQWTQFRQRFDALARVPPPRADSRGPARPASKPARPSTARVPAALNRSVSSQRSTRSRASQASVGSRGSRRSLPGGEAEALERDIDRREAELAAVKAQYKQLLFREERALTDPLLREKANFFAREVQSLSRELLELRKRQRQLFALEYIS